MRKVVSSPDSDPTSPLKDDNQPNYSNRDTPESWNDSYEPETPEDGEVNSPIFTSGNEGGDTNTAKYPTEVEGFNVDAPDGGITPTNIPPTTNNPTINTTTLQQTTGPWNVL